MGNQTKFPSVPLVTGLNPPALQQFAQAVRENINIMNGVTGDPLDANVSFRDLASAGVIQIGTGVASANSQQVAIAAGLMATVSNATDYTPPPAPTNLSASGAMGNTILTWDMPTYANHSYTEIWREQVTFTGGVADASVIGNAVLVGTSSGYVGVYADATGAASDCYYWIKFVSTASVAGPFNAVPGTRGTTSTDPAYLLSLLTGNPNAHSVIAGFPFTVLTVPTVINGITIPAGVYLNGTMFQDGLITTSKLAAGAVTADKITTASLSALSANMGSITAGSMNINNKFIVDPFGNVTATSGAFSGSLSGADITGATGTFGGLLAAGVVDITKLIGTTTNYLTPGTYTLTVPADKTSMRVTLVGGGGNGGNGAGAVGGGGGGGGAGGLTIASFANLTPGATYSLIVGAQGQATSVTGIAAASGGTNGTNGSPDPTMGGNGSGGTGGTTGGANGVAEYKVYSGGNWTYQSGSGGSGGKVTGFGSAGAGGYGGPVYVTYPAVPANPGTAGTVGGGGGGGAGTGAGGVGGVGFASIEFYNPNGVVIRNEWNTLLSALTRQGIAST